MTARFVLLLLTTAFCRELSAQRYRKVDDPKRPADQYPVDHSAGMFLLGPDGSYIRKLGYGSSLESIIDRIQALLTEEAAQIKPSGA